MPTSRNKLVEDRVSVKFWELHVTKSATQFPRVLFGEIDIFIWFVAIDHKVEKCSNSELFGSCTVEAVTALQGASS